MNYYISLNCYSAGSWSPVTICEKGIPFTLPVYVSCHLFTPSVVIQSGRWLVGCDGHIAETEAEIKQLVVSSCGVPRAPRPLFKHFLSSIHTLVFCLVLLWFPGSCRGSGGAPAYFRKIISTSKLPIVQTTQGKSWRNKSVFLVCFSSPLRRRHHRPSYCTTPSELSPIQTCRIIQFSNSRYMFAWAHLWHPVPMTLAGCVCTFLIKSKHYFFYWFCWFSTALIL